MTHDTMMRRPISQGMQRRDLLRGGVAALAAGLTAGLPLDKNAHGVSGATNTSEREDTESMVRRGRVKQSICSWPFMLHGPKWSLEELCRAARELGCQGVELVEPEAWSTLERFGLICAMAPNGMPGAFFEKGLNNPRYQEQVIAVTTQRIEECARANVPSVVAFTGMEYRDLDDRDEGVIPPDEGARNTVQGLKELARHAERHGVYVCLEQLNSRIEGDDYRGHPGFQGDDFDYCARIVREVDSPRVKLLADIYHIQIMNGDVIARIRANADIIQHIHTGGVPGRVELDESQELQYRPIIEALIESGFDGYIGQEFIPTGPAMEGLREAVALCDV